MLHEQFAVPPDLVRCFLLNGLRRPPCVALLLPRGSACSRHTAAPPAPRTTFLHTNRSWPELAQRGHRHALHAAALHVVALHIVALHSYSSSSYCRARARPGLAASHLHMPKPRASLARSHPCAAAALLLLARRCTAPAPASPPFLPLTGMAATARLGRDGALGSPGPGPPSFPPLSSPLAQGRPHPARLRRTRTPPLPVPRLPRASARSPEPSHPAPRQRTCCLC
jgi:hypothetical protein